MMGYKETALKYLKKLYKKTLQKDLQQPIQKQQVKSNPNKEKIRLPLQTDLQQVNTPSELPSYSSQRKIQESKREQSSHQRKEQDNNSQSKYYLEYNPNSYSLNANRKIDNENVKNLMTLTQNIQTLKLKSEKFQNQMQIKPEKVKQNMKIAQEHQQIIKEIIDASHQQQIKNKFSSTSFQPIKSRKFNEQNQNLDFGEVNVSQSLKPPLAPSKTFQTDEILKQTGVIQAFQDLYKVLLVQKPTDSIYDFAADFFENYEKKWSKQIQREKLEVPMFKSKIIAPNNETKMSVLQFKTMNKLDRNVLFKYDQVRSFGYNVSNQVLEKSVKEVSNLSKQLSNNQSSKIVTKQMPPQQIKMKSKKQE